MKKTVLLIFLAVLVMFSISCKNKQSGKNEESITENVTENVTEDVTENVTEDVTEDVPEDVTGNDTTKSGVDTEKSPNEESSWSNFF